MSNLSYYSVLIASLPILIEIAMYELFNYSDLLVGRELDAPKKEHLERLHAYSFLTLIAISMLITGIQNIEENYTLLGLVFVAASVFLFIGAYSLSLHKLFHNKIIRSISCIFILSIICLDLYIINM